MFKNRVTSLQIYQLIKYSATLVINILLAKSYLTLKELGHFETFLFYFSFVSFFWINGFIQALLVNYNSSKNNKILLFNTFILFLVFSFIAAFLVLLFTDIQTNTTDNNLNIKILLFVYTILNPISFLIEYIYFLQSKYKSLIIYGVVSLILQVVLVAFPALLGFGLFMCFYGIIIFAFLKIILLIYLLKFYSTFRLDKVLIKKQLLFALPLILTSILAGSASYIDSFIIQYNFNSETFAVFRYGAKEFPLFILVANTFSNSILPEFSNNSIKIVLNSIKIKSRKLILLFLPITILLLLFSHIIYPYVFSYEFIESYKIFDIYLLLIVSRLVFPQTILIGLEKTKLVAAISTFELIINVVSSIILIHFFGIIGVAYGTVIAFYSEKLITIFILKQKLSIKISEYIDLKNIAILLLMVYSVFILKLFYVRF